MSIRTGFIYLKYVYFGRLKAGLRKGFACKICVENAEFMCNELFTLLETLTLDDCAFVKGVFTKNVRGCRLTAKNYRW